jgi:hypothetical protein
MRAAFEYQCRRPAESAGDDPPALDAGVADQVVGGHSNLVEVQTRGHHVAMAELS